MAFVSFVTFAVGHMVLRKKCGSCGIPVRYGGAFEPEILSTSTSLWTSALLLAGSTWAATVLLSRHSSGLTELALYNAADRWKTVVLFLPQTLFQVILPMLSHSHANGDYQTCRRIVSAALASTVVVTAVGAIPMLSLSRGLMSAYGPSFAAGTKVLSLAAAVAIVSAIYTVGSSALWALGSPAQMLGIDICKTALFLGLCWMSYATSAWNLMFAYLLTFSVGSIVVLLGVHRQLRVRT
jgi:O-antigen/teichoic acid export membrane protein